MVVEHTDYGESQPDKIIRLIDCVIINTNINSYESTDEEGNVRTCWEADAERLTHEAYDTLRAEEIDTNFNEIDEAIFEILAAGGQ